MKNNKYEIKILSNISETKNIIKSKANFFYEDFLLDDIVFIEIDDLNLLNVISNSILVKEEEYAHNYYLDNIDLNK